MSKISTFVLQIQEELELGDLSIQEIADQRNIPLEIVEEINNNIILGNE